MLPSLTMTFLGGGTVPVNRTVPIIVPVSAGGVGAGVPAPAKVTQPITAGMTIPMAPTSLFIAFPQMMVRNSLPCEYKAQGFAVHRPAGRFVPRPARANRRCRPRWADHAGVSPNRRSCVAYLVICATALVVAALTLFSGFGLGTLLMPAFALFFPVKVAIAATAVVHLANSLFKVALIGKDADWGVVLRFGIPAALFAMLGAGLLGLLADIPPLARYTLGEAVHTVTPVKLVVAALMIGFAALEVVPQAGTLAFPPRYLPLGGALSGFFGGLSGHQGALRAAFLVRAGLTKEAFVGTTAVAAVIVDVSRLLVYGVTFVTKDVTLLQDEETMRLVAAGTLAAIVGSFLGVRLIKKVTMRTIQGLVAVMLALVGVALGAGLLPDR